MSTTITITNSWDLSDTFSYTPRTRNEACKLIDSAEMSDIIKIMTPHGVYESEMRDLNYPKFDKILLGPDEYNRSQLLNVFEFRGYNPELI